MRNSSENRPIAVLFIVPSLRRAGAETQVVNLVNGLDSNNFKKHLLIFEEETDLLDRVDRDSVQFHHARRTRRWVDISLVHQIKEVIEKEDIDVVHCSLQFSVLWGWLARATTKRKPHIVAVLHTTINVDLKTELQDVVLYQWILRRCQGIVFVCDRQREYWESKYRFLKGRSDVVYNGVDTDWFEPTSFHSHGESFRQDQDIPADSVVLTCIARFSPEKGQQLLVTAFSAAPRGALYLVLAGDGPLRLEVERQVKHLGLDEHVRFLGNVSDVRPVLAASDVLVLPSTAVETFSMAMLESLSMATPVLGSDIGGMREAVIENETGALVPAGDVDSLTRRIMELTADKERLRAMGARGRELVVQQFSEKLMLENTARMIKRIAGPESRH
jgi:glycosyltransferase involved in cell wall biosynthesis